MVRPNEDQSRGAQGSTKQQRKDGALESSLGHPESMPGSGADLASTDMEVMEPSPSKENAYSDNTPRPKKF